MKEGCYLLEEVQNFGLRNSQLGLRRNHGSLKKSLQGLCQGLDLSLRNVLVCKIIKTEDLRVNEVEHSFRVKRGCGFELGKDGGFSFKESFHFRRKDRLKRRHYRGLSNGLDVLCKGSAGDGLVVGKGLRL